MELSDDIRAAIMQMSPETLKNHALSTVPDQDSCDRSPAGEAVHGMLGNPDPLHIGAVWLDKDERQREGRIVEGQGHQEPGGRREE